MPSLSELEGQAADGRMTVVRWGLLTTEHVSNWYDGTARRSDDAPAAGYLDLLLRVNAEESHHGISACNSLRGCKTHSAAWSAAGCPEPSDAFASLQRRQSGNIPATHLASVVRTVGCSGTLPCRRPRDLAVAWASVTQLSCGPVKQAPSPAESSPWVDCAESTICPLWFGDGLSPLA